MRDLINTTTDKMMLYNARTVNGKQMQDFVGDEFAVTDIVQYETERKNTPYCLRQKEKCTQLCPLR